VVFGTTIVSQTSGSTGGAGVYVTSVPTTATGSLVSTIIDYTNLATLSAATISPGDYATCIALGLIRINALAARVTAHVQGDATQVLGGYVNTVAGIVKRILTQKGGINATTLDGSFAALDTAFPYECGVYVGPAQSGGATSAPQSTLLKPIIVSSVGIGNTLQSACDAVLLSGGCWLAPTRINTWTIGQLIAPSGTPVAVFTDVDLISVDSQATADQTAGVPMYSVNLRYKHYPGVLQKSEPAGSLLPAQVADITTEWRTATATDNTVLTTHLLSPQLYRDSCLNVQANAQAEANRILTLHKVRRDYVKATVYLDETKAAIDLGSVIQLVTPRLGYTTGRLFVVVGISTDGRKHELTLDLWG
jgi:hypothetical protein